MSFRSIRSKLIAAFILVVLGMTATLTWITTSTTEDALRAEIEAQHAAQARIVADDLDSLVADALRLASAATFSQAVQAGVPDEERTEHGAAPQGAAADVRRDLAATIALSPLLASVHLYDVDAGMVLVEPYAAQVAASVADDDEAAARRLVAVALAGERATPFVHRGADPGSWAIIAPIHAERGFLGALVFHGASAPLRGFLAEAAGPRGDQYFLLDDQGIVVAAPTGHPPGTDLRAMLDAATARPGSIGFAIDGADHLASHRAITNAAWHVILATAEDVAFAPVTSLRNAILVFGAVMVAIGVALSVVLAQHFAEPLGRLKEAAQRVTAGEYGTQVRIPRRDEFADLAGAFNAMSARLLEENQRLLRYQGTLEETVQKRTSDLREKNDELEAFVYAASHDLRTPIISLDWLATELHEQLDGQASKEAVQATLERIRANVDGMEKLVSDLLELSRIGHAEGTPDRVRIGDIIDEVHREHAERLQERTARLETDVPADAVVLADPRRMHQVFTNLVANAVKYGRDQGGIIIVRARPVGPAEHPWKWRIEVEDNGPGIDAEVRERIFLLFQRAPDRLGRAIPGTGVGLAIVRKIIRSYGGDVQVTDAPGGGALFWFTLPCAPPAEPIVTAPMEPAEHARADARDAARPRPSGARRART